MRPIVPHLWFERDVEEACRFYARTLPDSRVDSVTALPSDSPSGPAGTVKMVELTLLGAPFVAIGAGPLDPFNHAISFLIPCDTQAEIDRLTAALVEGGEQEDCGWVRDRYGLSWQVVPTVLQSWLKSPDRARAKRVSDAMLKMKKLDLAVLQHAFDGDDDSVAAASSVV